MCPLSPVRAEWRKKSDGLRSITPLKNVEGQLKDVGVPGRVDKAFPRIILWYVTEAFFYCQLPPALKKHFSDETNQRVALKALAVTFNGF